MKITIGCVAALLCVSVALGEDTSWQAPDTGGDWFDANNWSAGVPTADDTTVVFGPGTAKIGSGLAESRFLHLGYGKNGRIVQTGGSYEIVLDTRIGDGSYVGQYSLIGGEFITDSMHLRSSAAAFQQTGGLSRIDYLNVKGPMSITGNGYPDSAAYELIGGQLETRHARIGTDGRGLFRQVGGIHNVQRKLSIGGSDYYGGIIVIIDPNFPVLVGPLGPVTIGPIATNNSWDATASLVTCAYIPMPRPSSGRYELAGGMLNSRELEIDKTGSFEQTGGVNNAGYLAIRSAGRYSMSGGSLGIELGLDMDFGSAFDLSGSAVNVTGGGLLNFSKGYMRNTENASLSVSANSLTIFPVDFDPNTRLGSFQSDGLVHFAGSDLVIAADEGFSGWGSIDDHVKTSGTMTASHGEGIGGIDLGAGIMVNAGSVNLGRGDITVTNNRSGIRSGELYAENMSIRGFIQSPEQPEPRGAFVQTGGETTLSERLEVSTTGAYELHSGTLSARRIDIGPLNSGSATFIQTGGICNVEQTLYLGRTGSLLMRLAGSNAMLTDTSASASIVGYGRTGEESSSMYFISGGRLTAGDIYLHASNVDKRFIQTGGIVEVGSSVAIYDSRSSYTMHGGRLDTKEIKLGSKYSQYSRGGAFAILSQDAEVNVSQTLLLGSRSQLTASPGATIHMHGIASLANYSTDSDALSGLGNLTLIFEGGDGYDSRARFEVAGADLGDNLAGYFDNFLLDTLQVGGDVPGWLLLVDMVDNQTDYDGQEALYVKNLIVTEGSTLNLNGLNIYYLNADIAAGSLINGGLAYQYNGILPEPATLGMLVIGSGMLLTRKRRT